MLKNVLITQLLLKDGRVCGAAGVDGEGKPLMIAARTVVLATGGMAAPLRAHHHRPRPHRRGVHPGPGGGLPPAGHGVRPVHAHHPGRAPASEGQAGQRHPPGGGGRHPQQRGGAVHGALRPGAEGYGGPGHPVRRHRQGGGRGPGQPHGGRVCGRPAHPGKSPAPELRRVQGPAGGGDRPVQGPDRGGARGPLLLRRRWSSMWTATPMCPDCTPWAR